MTRDAMRALWMVWILVLFTNAFCWQNILLGKKTVIHERSSREAPWR
jgi:hypothetical protein